MTPKKDERSVRVRIAPSPTGPITVGTARTALFNWLFAKKHGGIFVMRIEDTDKERSKRAFEADIFDGLRWLGLLWDEGPATLDEPERGIHGPYRQSERGELYCERLEQLLREGKAYYCYCTKEELEAERQTLLAEGLPPRYGGHCRKLPGPPKGKSAQAIRFRTPEGTVEFKDLVRGKVSFDAALFGDMIIAKDLDAPLYNFAVVVDDALMEISHVIRGEDHLSNTPKQILLFHALGFPLPSYAHIPLLLAPDRSKLSKRTADASFLELREKGYLPEAVVNFLALLGWHPKGDRELFAPQELIEIFDLARVQKGGAVFTTEKLTWLNGEHVKRLTADVLRARLVPFFEKAGISSASEEFLERVINAQKDRATTLSEFVEQSRFFFRIPSYEAALLLWKGKTLHDTLQMLQGVRAALEEINERSFGQDAIRHSLEPLVAQRGRGEVFWPFRVAVSGQAASPDPVIISEVLGKEETLLRITNAIEKLTLV